MTDTICPICDNSGIEFRMCSSCNGSGEGYNPDTRCIICKGAGSTPRYCRCLLRPDDPDDDNDDNYGDI